MISIPDDLLARLDEHARRLGTTRSGLLRELAERELVTDAAARREEILALLGRARGHGGGSARFVRAMRDSR